MRIQCEVCSATYTIDDGQLTDQPVGAQCPYCGHVKLVTAAGPVDEASGAAGAPPPPEPPVGGGGGFSTYGANDGPPPDYQTFSSQVSWDPDGGAGEAYEQTKVEPSGFASDGGFETYGAPGDSGGYGAAPEPYDPYGSQPDPYVESASAASPGAYASFGGASDGLAFSSADLASEPASLTAQCSVCGVELLDEFDKVIGLCVDHQQQGKGQGQSAVPPSGPPAVGMDGPAWGRSTGDAALDVDQWWVRPRHGGHPEGPMSLDEVRGRLRRGELSTTDQVSRDGSQFSPIERHAELAYITALKRPDAAGTGGATGVSVHSSGLAGRLFKWGVILGGIGLVGYGGYTQREVVQRVYENLMEGRVSVKPIGLNPVRRLAATWTEELGTDPRSLAEITASAEASMLLDTWEGYRDADKGWKHALIADQDSAVALGGYVENFALGELPRASMEEVKFVEALIRYALRLHPDAVEVHRAAAVFAIERGRLDQCLEHGNAARKASAQDARTHLVLARCFFEGNVDLSVEEAEQARRLDPELRLATRVLGSAYARQGRFASALRSLNARLEATPGESATLLDLGDVHRSLGDASRARALYEQSLRTPGYEQLARMKLGELMLELRRPAEAASAFQAALRASAPRGPRGAAIFGGAARAELLAGRPERAAALADQALSFDREDLAALLVRGESAVLARDAETADRIARRALAENPNEPAVLVLAGRAAELGGRADDARSRFEAARDADPNDPRLAGVLAAHYLRSGQVNQGYVVVTEASNIDPRAARSRSLFSPFALSDPPVAQAIEAFRASAADERNAPVAHAAIGMMLYFSGERARAREEIDRALQLDSGILPGLLYDAQLELDEGRARQAARTCLRVLALERGHPLAHLIRARALVAMNRRDRAREGLESALRASPGFTAAKIELEKLRLAGPEKDEAMATLSSLFNIHPNDVSLRRALLEAEQ